MNKHWVGLVAATWMATHAAHANSQGTLDFLDPCKEQEQEFGSTSEALQARADAMISTWDASVEPPGEVRGLYVEAIREAAFKSWSEEPTVKAMLDQLKSLSPSFDSLSFFLEKVYPQLMTPEKEAELIRTIYRLDYEANIRPQFVKDRADLDAKIDEQRGELDQACKPDVFNQVIRATFGRALLIVNVNVEAAKNERGDLAKLVRATSGISLTDIEKFGILGGEGSELRKLVGGSGSELSKLITALDPAQWKIDLPTVALPAITLPEIRIEAPPPIKVGDVCIPWC